MRDENGGEPRDIMNTVPSQPDSTMQANPASPDTPAPVHKGRKHLLLGLGAVAVVAAAAWAGWQYWTVWQYEASTDDAYLHADYVSIAPQVSGYLISVNVGDNQPVRKGDILAIIDPIPYQAAVQQAQATIEHGSALIVQVRAELATQPSIIEEARASISVNEAVLKFAQENMARYGTLAREGFGTQQAREEAASNLGQAQARLELSRAALNAAEKRTATLTAELAAAQAALKQNEAALVQARFNLDRTVLRAPMDGVVGNRALRLGMYVQPGSQLLSIVPLHAVYVKANYKETNLAGIAPGMPVSIYVDTFPDTPVRGIVNSIAPAAGQTFALLPPDNATGNFTKIVQRVPVKITIDPHDKLAGQLRPGMSVTATVHLLGKRVEPEAFTPQTAPAQPAPLPASVAVPAPAPISPPAAPPASVPDAAGPAPVSSPPPVRPATGR